MFYFILQEIMHYAPDLHNVTRDKLFYTLVMFPYPSGFGLHVGHASNFVINDVLARYKRLQGYTVFNPFGFDSFGLPTENYAMKLGKPAYEVTAENIVYFKSQTAALDLSFDTEREVVTSSPEYYKRTQWLFQQLYKAGLVYRDTLRVNRCPECQTVLANDQVVEGTCERCKSEIIQKKHPQWFIKITDYADKLINDLDLVDRPEETKIAQKNWIGRSEGAEIDFAIGEKTITVFTTRPDTIYGVTALVLAPENTFLDGMLGEIYKTQVEEYRQTTLAKTAVQRQKDLKEKTGVFSGLYAKHPLTGEDVAIWYADYVLADYGTGAVMMVPAHDERDWEFAKKFGIDCKKVIALETGIKRDNEEFKDGGAAVVFDPNTQRYAVCELENGLPLLFAGGVSTDELVRDAVLREVVEESGLHNFAYVEHVETCYAHYYNILKNKNRYARSECFLVILQDTHTLLTALEDHEKFTLGWRSAEEIKQIWTNYSDNHNNGLDHYLRFLDESVARAIELGYDTTTDCNFFKATSMTEYGILEQSEQFTGLSSGEAKTKIAEHLESIGAGRKKISYKLRDWSVSRQRYWGSPIPVYYALPDEQVLYFEYQDAARKWKSDEPTLTRNVIQIIVKDKHSDQYAWIKRNHDQDYSGFFGGIENNESQEEAIRRELLEEGGFTDVTVQKHLLEYHCKFYHPTKKRNQYSICQVWLVEVARTALVPISAEEQKIHSIERLSINDFLKVSNNETTCYVVRTLLGVEQKTWQSIEKYNEFNPLPEELKVPHLIPEEELPVILPLDLENYKPTGKSPLEDHPTFPMYTPKNNTVPFQKWTWGVWNFHEGESVLTRKTILAILHNPKDDTYGIISWLGLGQDNYTFVLGGVDDGENPEIAAKREIYEETGYKNIRLVKKLGEFQTEFWHAVKNRNQHNITNAYLFELIDDTHDDGAKEENENLTFLWMTKQEILNLGQQEELRNYYLCLASGEQIIRKGAMIDNYNQYNPLPTYLRECDTLDTFMCSSFYFLRYPDANNPNELCDPQLLNKCFPIDFYIGGKEHTVGHLLYARFIHKFLYDQGYVSSPEPFQRLVHQGMVLGSDGRKMSKRRGNVIDPMEVIEKYGADAVRTYLMFMGPVEQEKVWNDGALAGVNKFLGRIGKVADLSVHNEKNDLVERALHKAIKGLTDDMEALKYNTAVSKLMILLNSIEEQKTITKGQLEQFMILLFPFAPKTSRTIWENLGNTTDIEYAPWPIFDASMLIDETISLPVQINGKVRANIIVAPDADETTVMDVAQRDEQIQKYLTGQTMRKVIYVQGRILNIVI